MVGDRETNSFLGLKYTDEFLPEGEHVFEFRQYYQQKEKNKQDMMKKPLFDLDELVPVEPGSEEEKARDAARAKKVQEEKERQEVETETEKEEKEDKEKGKEKGKRGKGDDE